MLEWVRSVHMTCFFNFLYDHQNCNSIMVCWCIPQDKYKRFSHHNFFPIGFSIFHEKLTNAFIGNDPSLNNHCEKWSCPNFWKHFLFSSDYHKMWIFPNNSF